MGACVHWRSAGLVTGCRRLLAGVSALTTPTPRNQWYLALCQAYWYRNTGWVAENIVEATTKTNLTGVLMGNGSLVSANYCDSGAEEPADQLVVRQRDDWVGWDLQRTFTPLAASCRLLVRELRRTARFQQTTPGQCIHRRPGLLPARTSSSSCRMHQHRPCSDGLHRSLALNNPPADTWFNVSYLVTARRNAEPVLTSTTRTPTQPRPPARSWTSTTSPSST